MPRLAILNMTLGFFLITLAAAAGPFIAADMTKAFLYDAAQLSSWQITLHTSAHGHTNLFGMTHVLFGLTLPYSALSPRLKILQTIGLGAGSFAMAVLMTLRGGLGPVAGLDALEIATGVLLSAALAALLSHAAGLLVRVLRRA